MFRMHIAYRLEYVQQTGQVKKALGVMKSTMVSSIVTTMYEVVEIASRLLPGLNDNSRPLSC